jgi:hypothetical protein
MVKICSILRTLLSGSRNLTLDPNSSRRRWRGVVLLPGCVHARQTEGSLSTLGDDPEWIEFSTMLAGPDSFASKLVAGRMADAMVTLHRP